MTIDFITLLAAFAGGLLGAAIGALPAFIFTGIVVLVGTAANLAGAPFDLVGNVAFGPVLGPHIAWAGGVAAAAYAKKLDILPSGKDVASPLAGLANPAVLAVGGIFGMGGYLLNQFLSAYTFGMTDTVALTVTVSSIVARVAFGKTGVFGTLTPVAAKRGRFTPGGENVWLPWMQDWLQVGVLGLGLGTASAWVTLKVAELAPNVAGAGVVVGFGLSAAWLIFLQFGHKVPVTHHMTLPAAVAASVSGSLWIGIVFGVVGALMGETFNRVFHIHGDTHIDPPANAIWSTTLLIMILSKVGLF